MPRPSRKAALSHRPSLTITPGVAAREHSHVQPHRPARVAEPHDVAVADAQLRRVVRVHQRGRPRLARPRGRRLVEARIEEVARRRGRELERMRLVRASLTAQWSGRRGIVAPAAAFRPSLAIRRRRPVGAEMELAVRMGEAVEIMRLLERRPAVEPAPRLEFGQRPAPGDAQRLVDDLARAHLEAAMFGAERAWRARRSPRGWSGSPPAARSSWRELQVLMRARGIDVVVLEEHRRGQHDVGVARGVGQELLVHAGEQILARKARAALFPDRARPPSDWCSGSASP